MVVTPTNESVQLNLEAADWYTATWRETPALEIELIPYNYDEVRHKLVTSGLFDNKVSRAALLKGRQYLIDIRPNIDKKTAYVWLKAILSAQLNHGKTTKSKLISDILDDLPNKITPQYGYEIHETLVNNRGIAFPPQATIAAWKVLSIGSQINFTERFPKGYDVFREQVLPYIPRKDFKIYHDVCEAYLSRAVWTQRKTTNNPPIYFWLAAHFGPSDLLYKFVLGWKDDQFGANSFRGYKLHPQRPQDIVLGLNHPDAVVQQMERLKLPLRTAYQVRGWLAHTEEKELDFVTRSILSTKFEKSASELTVALGRCVSAETAFEMIRLTQNKQSASAATKWLQDHPQQAIEGAIYASKQRGKIADEGRALLVALSQRGFEDEIAQLASADLLTTLTSHVDVPELSAENTPAWLADELQKIDIDPTLAVHPNDLPPIRTLDNWQLNQTQIRQVLTSFQKVKRLKLHHVLRAFADQASLDRFAWRLLEIWQNNGYNIREKWQLMGVAYLGSPLLATRFGGHAKRWPASYRDRDRMKLAFEILRRHGSDEAITELLEFRPRIKDNRLRSALNQDIQKVARARGIQSDRLSEVTIPHCGLAVDQKRVFDYGPRQFHLMIGANVQPFVVDENGKRRANLPSPRKSDDPLLVESARKELRLLKREIKEVAAFQAKRLEKEMVAQRVWTWEIFQKIYLEHPVMRHVVQTMIFGLYDEVEVVSEERKEIFKRIVVPAQAEVEVPPEKPKLSLAKRFINFLREPVFQPPHPTQPDKPKPQNEVKFEREWITETTSTKETKLTKTFRIAEDLTAADIEDEEFEIAADAKIVIIHPVLLSAETRTQWRDLLFDYEITPFFPQMARYTYSVDTADPDNLFQLKRLDDRLLTWKQLRKGWTKIEWQRKALKTNSRRWIQYHTRHFPKENIYALAHPVSDYRPQKGGYVYQIRSVMFHRGPYPKVNDDLSLIQLHEVPKIVLSEAMKDLDQLTSP